MRWPGMAAEWDGFLLKLLRDVAKGRRDYFVASSFRGITRHPEKLYRILEFLLSYDAAVVTANYLLLPTHVAQRIPLVRPGHTTAEEFTNFANQRGVSPLHRAYLQHVP